MCFLRGLKACTLASIIWFPHLPGSQRWAEGTGSTSLYKIDNCFQVSPGASGKRVVCRSYPSEGQTRLLTLLCEKLSAVLPGPCPGEDRQNLLRLFRCDRRILGIHPRHCLPVTWLCIVEGVEDGQAFLPPVDITSR